MNMPQPYHYPIETSRQAKARYRAQCRTHYPAFQQRKAISNSELLSKADELREQEKSRMERRLTRETRKASRLQHTAVPPRRQLPLSNLSPEVPIGSDDDTSLSVQHAQPDQLHSSPAPPPDLPWYVESRQTPSPPSSPPLPSLQTLLARRHAPTTTAVSVQDSLPVYHRSPSPAHSLAADSPNPESTIPLMSSSLPRSDHGLVQSQDHTAGTAQVPSYSDECLPSTASAAGFEDADPDSQNRKSAYLEYPTRSFIGIGWLEHLRRWSSKEEPSVARHRCLATPDPYPQGYPETPPQRIANSFDSEELLWEHESSLTDGEGHPPDPDRSFIDSDQPWSGHQAQLPTDQEEGKEGVEEEQTEPVEEYPLSLSAEDAFQALLG